MMEWTGGMSQTEVLLVALLLIFAGPYVLWRLVGGTRVVPMVVAQILSGIVFGPAILGAWAPQAHTAIFRPAVIDSLNGLAAWGVTLFVWLTALELDPGQVWKKRSETALTAGLALVAPLLLGAVVTLLALRQWSWVGPDGVEWQVVLAIGMACAVTALPVLVAILDELELTSAPLGQRLIRYASTDDVIIWAVLALVLLDGDRLLRQVSFLAAFAMAGWLIRTIMPRLPPRDRWQVALIWLVLSALAAEWAGLHYIMGAFLAGLVLDPDWFDRKRVADFRTLAMTALMPIYFLASGLRTHWGASGLEVLAGAALLLGAAVLGKLAGVHLAGRLLGWSLREAALVGWLLQTKGLVLIVFVNILLDRGVITAEAFTALLLMATASTALTSPVVRPLLASTTSTRPFLEPKSSA